jgi:hypothetical protein
MATPEQQAAALAARRLRFDTRIIWLGEQVERGMQMTMRARVRLAAQLVRDKVVINLSTPVRKIPGRQGRNATTGRFTRRRTKVDPASRSRPGEFPRADTTRLMKDIFYEVREGGMQAIVGTTLDYGLILETVMNRSFLRRTLDELQPAITRLLTAGGPGTEFPNT